MTTLRVNQLFPGDIIVGPQGKRAIFVQQAQHPIYQHLQLVVWRMLDDQDIPGEWSHDALDRWQEIGEGERPAHEVELQANLRKALLHRSQW